MSTRQQEIDVVLNDLKTHEITVETSLVDIMNKKEKIMLSNTTQNDQRRTSQESLTENEGKKLFKYVRITKKSHSTILTYLSILHTIDVRGHIDLV